MTFTTPRRAATRRRLIEAAISEFAANGIDATSVEHISESAGFTRGAFYSNFADKDELVLAVVEHVHAAANAAFTAAITELPEGISVHEAVGLVLRTRMISPEVHTTMLEISLRSRHNPALAERLTDRRNDIGPTFSHILTMAAERLGLRLTVATEDLIDVIDALYESSFVLRTAGAEDRMIYLTGLIAERFTAPK